MTRMLFRCTAALLLSPSLAQARARNENPVLRHATQLLVVTTADWNATTGRLQRFDRSTPGAAWRPVGEPTPVVVGDQGLAWGIGLGPALLPQSATDPVKREGDHRSPAGLFRLGPAFGDASEEPADWHLPYVALTPSVECVDDPRSRVYNRIVDRSTIAAPDWTSSEHMRAVGDNYRWGLVIGHNTAVPRPGAGSCIFLHVWSGPSVGTVGCTAMPLPALTAILGWLRPSASPLLLELPVAQYDHLRKVYHLPKLHLASIPRG